MKMAAMEWSTAQRSVALLDGERCVASAVAEERADLPQDALSSLLRLLQDTGWMWTDIDAIAVGRGPGRYAGMRMAMATAQGLSVAGGHRLFTVSSGEALAWQASEVWPEASHIAVIGDARRDQVWAGLFVRHEAGLQVHFEWTLYRMPDLLEQLPHNTYVVTSDADRWPGIAESVRQASLVWRDEPRFPSAEWIGRLAARRIAVGIASDPITPIYMHPPVALPGR